MNTKRNSQSRYALLGLLTLGPMTGYEMKKFMESSIAHFWHESFGNIYPLLKRLHREKMVTCRVSKRAGRPERQVYSLTARGRKELHQWLMEPVPGKQIKSELLLKLFFANQIPLEDIGSHLTSYEASQRKLLDTYATARLDLEQNKNNDPNQLFWLMTLRRGELVAQARHRWCRECLQSIEKMKDK